MQVFIYPYADNYMQIIEYCALVFSLIIVYLYF